MIWTISGTMEHVGVGGYLLNTNALTPFVRQAFTQQGWSIVSVRLVGNSFSSSITFAIEANVNPGYNANQIRESAFNVLSTMNLYDLSGRGFTYILDQNPTFSNIYVAQAVNKSAAGLDTVLTELGGLDALENTLGDIARNPLALGTTGIILLGAGVLTLVLILRR